MGVLRLLEASSQCLCIFVVFVYVSVFYLPPCPFLSLLNVSYVPLLSSCLLPTLSLT